MKSLVFDVYITMFYAEIWVIIQFGAAGESDLSGLGDCPPDLERQALGVVKH